MECSRDCSCHNGWRLSNTMLGPPKILELHFLGIVKRFALWNSLPSLNQWNCNWWQLVQILLFPVELLRFINTFVFVRSQNGKVVIIHPYIKARTVFPFFLPQGIPFRTPRNPPAVLSWPLVGSSRRGRDDSSLSDPLKGDVVTVRPFFFSSVQVQSNKKSSRGSGEHFSQITVVGFFCTKLASAPQTHVTPTVFGPNRWIWSICSCYIYCYW